MFISVHFRCFRDPPEPTGDDPDDLVVEPPRIYEPVSMTMPMAFVSAKRFMIVCSPRDQLIQKKMLRLQFCSPETMNKQVYRHRGRFGLYHPSMLGDN